MKRRVSNAVTVGIFSVVILMILVTTLTRVVATSTPYYTYTTDNEFGWVRTSDAYTPNGQILDADGSPFRILEYVYVDHEDYVYVTDSGQSLVFIYDKDLNFVDKIEYYESEPGAQDGFFAVNSIFVSEDKVYVPDSFRKSVFVFDRESVINRPPAYTLWMEDVDASDTLSDGDVMYLADPETDQPIGAPVYETRLNGQTDDGKDIIDFLDFDTKEVVFTKIDKTEMIGKILSWVSTEYEGKTLLKNTIYAEKNKPVQVVKTPDAPAFIGDPEDPYDGYTFAPKKIVVDSRGNMYIVGAQSDAGLIMLGPEGDFITFFGGNPLRTPLIDQIRSVLLTEVQKETLREQSDIYIDYISGVAIDRKGFVYTVTSTLQNNNIKKFNVSGKNYFNTNALGWVGAVDLWVAQYGNVYTVDEFGWINEYSENGELIFSFSATDIGIDREGLLSLPKSIATDSNDNLYVVDQGNKLLQIYQPTEFANAVHRAFEAYQAGDEDIAADLWKYSLEYATVFDIAHVGLGNAYVRQDNYEGALNEYTLASYNQGISDTYWQIRQVWMEQNLEVVFLVVLGLIIAKWIFGFFDRKYQFTRKPKEKWAQIKKQNRILDELAYIKEFIKHPLDGYYYVKRKNRVSITTASIIYFLLAALYVFYQVVTNDIFLADSNPNVIYDLIILASILALWVIANYFVCLIHDGEGSFKNVYVATAMSLTPILLVVPFVAILSNVLTYQEAVFFNVPLSLTMIWVAIYFFFMIKEIHNYEVGETFNVIFISMFTMLIMGIFIFVVYSLNSQIFNVTIEIARELIER